MTGPDKKPLRLTLPRDPLFRLLAINGLAGTAVAGLVLGGIFATNIGNLRTLVLSAEDPVLPVLMLAFALVITLGSVVIGSAIMLLGDTGGAGGNRRGRRRPPTTGGQLVPVALPVAAHKGRGLPR